MNHLNQIILEKLNHKYNMSELPLDVTELLRVAYPCISTFTLCGSLAFITVQYGTFCPLHRATKETMTSLCCSLQK